MTTQKGALLTWCVRCTTAANRTITHYQLTAKAGPTWTGLGRFVPSLACSHLIGLGADRSPQHRALDNAQSRCVAPLQAKSRSRISGKRHRATLAPNATRSRATPAAIASFAASKAIRFHPIPEKNSRLDSKVGLFLDCNFRPANSTATKLPMAFN